MKKTIASFLVVVLVAGAVPTQAFAHRRGGSGSSPASLGLIAGIFALVLGAAYFIGREKEDTDRVAITEGNRTKREGIRAGTVLAAPRALGGSGDASYSSTEGEAKIQANSALGGAAPAAPEKVEGREMEEGGAYTEERRSIKLPDVRALEKLYGNIERYSPSEEERVALYGSIEETRDPGRTRFGRRTLRRYLDSLHSLKEKVLGVGAPVRQVAELEKLIKYLEVIVFGKEIV